MLVLVRTGLSKIEPVTCNNLTHRPKIQKKNEKAMHLGKRLEEVDAHYKLQGLFLKLSPF